MSRIYSTQSLESDRSTTCSPENELISESGDSWLGQNFNWLGCARYLNSLNLLSSEISNSLRIQQLTIDDFAEMLSDGEALCALVNFLAPGCIDLSRTNKQSQFKSKIIASQNIRLFLDKCKTTLNLSDDDLFTESMFGPNEFGKVIDSLSKISTSDLALKRTALLGFSAKLLFPE